METETQTANGHGTSVPAIKQATVKDSVKNPGSDLISTFGKGLIYQKMVAIMKEIAAVGKDQTNTVQNFKFRGIDQFINALHPLCVKHGVFVNPQNVSYKSELKEVTRSSGKLGVDKHVELLTNYIFIAEDGSSVTLGPIPSEGLDSGDKATNKALSSGLKYLLIQTFLVPTADMAEADADSPEHGTPAARKAAPAPEKTAPAASAGTTRGGFKAPTRNAAPKEEKPAVEANTKSEPQAAAAPATTSAETSAKTPAAETAAPAQPAETTQQSAPATSATGSAETSAAPATPAAAPKNAKERARFNPPKKTQREE